MINTVVLTGRLTRDPELKFSQSGVAVCRFTLAVNRSFANANGEREADFPNIVTFKRQAENVANHLKKGSLAGVEGRIQTSNFEGKDGNRVFMTEIIANSVQFLEPKSSNQQNTQNNASTGYQSQPNTNTPNYNSNGGNQQNLSNGGPFGGGAPTDIGSDDLPF